MWLGLFLYLAVGLLIFPLSKCFPRLLGPSRELMQVAVGAVGWEPVAGLLFWAFWPFFLVFSFFISSAALEAPVEPSPDSSVTPTIGATGVATTDLKLSGKVEVDGQAYNAKSTSQFISKGASIRIADTQGPNVIVELLDE